jgi:hypothetical protein
MIAEELRAECARMITAQTLKKTLCMPEPMSMLTLELILESLIYLCALIQKAIHLALQRQIQ